MIGYEKSTEVLTCCTLDNHCDYYYLTLLVIYEHLNILAMFGLATPHSLAPLKVSS